MISFLVVLPGRSVAVMMILSPAMEALVAVVVYVHLPSMRVALPCSTGDSSASSIWTLTAVTLKVSATSMMIFWFVAVPVYAEWFTSVMTGGRR